MRLFAWILQNGSSVKFVTFYKGVYHILEFWVVMENIYRKMPFVLSQETFCRKFNRNSEDLNKIPANMYGTG